MHGCGGVTNGLDWAPHVTLCYSTADQLAQPIIDALGMRQPERQINISSISLVIQDRPERGWNWTDGRHMPR
jgi:hypothetical protein